MCRVETSYFIPGGAWNPAPDRRRSPANIVIPSRRGCLRLFVLQRQQAQVSRMREYPQESSLFIPLLLFELAVNNSGFHIFRHLFPLMTP